MAVLSQSRFLNKVPGANYELVALDIYILQMVSTRYMKYNQTSYLILGMLSIEPSRSGYDIRKTVESSISYFWNESYGQIYPTLKRLAVEGLVVSRQANTNGRPERREYSITDEGRKCLQEWLTSPYRNDPPRNELLLKLFFGQSASPMACREHLRTFHEQNKKLLATLLDLETQAQIRHTGNPNLPYWLLTISYGVAHVRASIAWSESALANGLIVESGGA